jgi:transposase-like protein
MSLDNKEPNANSEAKENSAKVLCPFCKSESTKPIDAKKALADKSLYLCLVCSQVFEYLSPRTQINNIPSL